MCNLNIIQILFEMVVHTFRYKREKKRTLCLGTFIWLEMFIQKRQETVF